MKHRSIKSADIEFRAFAFFNNECRLVILDDDQRELLKLFINGLFKESIPLSNEAMPIRVTTYKPESRN